MQAWWAIKKADLQETHWGYPEEFEERPFGTSLSAHLRTHVANGMAARMVLYQYDFHQGVDDAFRLNAHGRRRLDEITRMLQCDVWPVVIEPSDEGHQLDCARRDHVLKLLSECIGTVLEEWVVVAYPEASGLEGEEAVIIYANLLRQTRMRGSTSTARRSSLTTITSVGSSNTSDTSR